MNTENNKLIAEFLGDKIELRDYGSALPGKQAFYYISKNVVVFLCMYNGTDNAYHEVWMREAAKLTFHKDWNALMEVVEKIEDCTLLSDVGMNVNSYNTVASIQCRWKGSVTGTGQGKTRLQALYYAVVEFITWYNRNTERC